MARDAAEIWRSTNLASVGALIGPVRAGFATCNGRLTSGSANAHGARACRRANLDHAKRQSATVQPRHADVFWRRSQAPPPNPRSLADTAPAVVHASAHIDRSRFRTHTGPQIAHCALPSSPFPPKYLPSTFPLIHVAAVARSSRAQPNIMFA